MTSTATPTRPGIRYRATRNSDGTSNVHGVPIFGTLPAGERGNAKEIGREWMLAAIDGARSEETRGFLAPLKPTHASGMAKASGYVRPTHVAREEYEGEAIDVLFADFIGIHADEFAAISRGDWPYRSVEVRAWDVPRINAVALLAADPPYFRFPMIAGVLLDESQAGQFAAMKFSAFAQEEPAVPDEKKTPDEDAGALAKIERMLGSLVAGMQKLLGGGDKAQGEVTPEPVTDTPPEEAKKEPEPDAAMVAKEEGAEDKDSTEEEMPDEKKGGEMSAAPSASLAAMTADRDGIAAKFSALQTTHAETVAKLSAAEAKIADGERSTVRATAIAEARAKLRAKRVILATDFDVLAAQMHDASPAAFSAFVSTLETSGKRDPVENFGGGAMIVGTGDAEIDAAVHKFAAGREAGTYEAAVAAAESYRAFRSKAPKSTVTIREWLDVEVRPASPSRK